MPKSKIIRISLFILAALFCAEAGLQAHGILQTEVFSRLSTGGFQSSVLLVGDSILGLDDVRTAAGYVGAELSAHAPGRFRVVNLSSPANSTNRVILNIDQALEKYQPAVVVLLLGKSDAESQTGAPTQSVDSGLSTIKLFRLSWLLDQQIQKWYSRARLTGELLLAKFRQPSPISEDPASKAEFAELDGLERRKEYGNFSARLHDIHQSGRSLLAVCNASASLAALNVRLGKTESIDYLGEAIACVSNFESGVEVNNSMIARLSTAIANAYKELGDLKTAELYYQKAIQAIPGFTRSFSDLGWMYFNHEKCDAAIAPLEFALKNATHWRNSISALYKCYLQEGKLLEGERFFREIATGSSEEKLLNLLAQSLENQRRNQFAIEDIDFKGAPANRDKYLALLWVYSRLHRDDLANALYRRLELFDFQPVLGVNRELYRDIVHKILATNARIIVVHYPNNANEPFFDEIANERPRVSVVKMRELILKAVFGSDDTAEGKVLELLAPDFEHLSDEGARLVGRAIATEIERGNNK